MDRRTFVRTHIRNTTDDADNWTEREVTGALTAEPLNGIPGHLLISESSPPSQESAGSISDSPAPDGSTSGYASETSTAAPSSPSDSPESRSGMTCEVWGWTTDVYDKPKIGEMGPLRSGLGGPHGFSNNAIPLVCSAAASPAKTSPSRDDVRDSPGSGPACSSSSPGSLSLFDPSGFSSRTYPDCSPRTAVGTSESCLERWPTSGTAWPGGFSTADSSECPSADGACSSSQVTLADVLEPNAPARYSLSARAAAGILRRAEKRGRSLPESLALALTALAAGETRRAA